MATSFSVNRNNHIIIINYLYMYALSTSPQFARLNKLIKKVARWLSKPEEQIDQHDVVNYITNSGKKSGYRKFI